MLIISEIRGKDLENRFLPRFFLLTFCTLRVQNVLAKYPNLLTKFLGDVDQAKKKDSAKTSENTLGKVGKTLSSDDCTHFILVEDSGGTHWATGQDASYNSG